MSADLTEFEELTENDELRRQVTDLQQKLRRAKAKTADLVAAVEKGARDAAIVLGNPPAVKAPRKDGRAKRGEVAILHVSDWQIGKVTDSYNSEIAAARVDELADKVVKLADIERADHPVRELHVLLGGDLIEGVNIFPGQPFEVDSATFKQVFTAVGGVERLLRAALSSFEHVVVWEVPGNHGRVGRRGENPRTDNVDLLAYRIAARSFDGHKRIDWHPSTSWRAIVEAGNYRALLVHGDQIKQFGGNLPAYGIYRKSLGWSAGAIKDQFTDVYMGHFHRPDVIHLADGEGRVFINGSLESDNEFAAEFIAASGTPRQRLNFVDPERGRVTTERLIWLDT